jgi:hypothetical protein
LPLELLLIQGKRASWVPRYRSLFAFLATSRWRHYGDGHHSYTCCSDHPVVVNNNK